MSKARREFERPGDWAAALQILGPAGGQAQPIFVGPRPEALTDRPGEVAVDLSALGLAYVEEREPGVVNVGALTTLQALAEAPGLASVADNLLAEAARAAAHVGLRNVATVGGVLASPDGPPEVLLALLALEAVVVVRGQTAVEMPLADYLAADGPPQGAVVTEVKIRRRHLAGALARVARTPRDQAIVAAAACLEVSEGLCRRARIAVAGAAPSPRRMPSSEARLEGRPLSSEHIKQAAAAAAAEAAPVSTYTGSAEYRRAMTAVLVRRVLDTASRRAAPK